MKKQVLIVDDEKDLARVFKNYLKDYDVEVEIKHSVLECHTTVINKKYDLILLDYNLPTYKGSKLVDALKLTTLNENTPVVVISAHLEDPVVEEFRTKGIHDFIKKPIDLKEFHSKVRKFLIE